MNQLSSMLRESPFGHARVERSAVPSMSTNYSAACVSTGGNKSSMLVITGMGTRGR